MTTADLTRELRAARPVAPPALRARVAAAAERGPAPAPQRFWRPRRRGLFALVPAAAAVAVAGAVTIGLTRPEPSPDTPLAVEATAPPGAADSTAASPGGAGAGAAKIGSATERAQRVTAQLTVRVDGGDALSDATKEALQITRTLGGYVVRSDVVAGDGGAASLSLRIPAANAQEAIAQLSDLGTIIDQRVQIDDLQATLDGLDAQIAQTQAALATVRARLAGDDLTAEQRARLQTRRDQLVATLAGLRAQRTGTASEAAEATIQLELRTERSAGLVPVPSRLDRSLDRALDVLAWEAVTVLVVAIVLAPLALAWLAVIVVRRISRRRDEERLLGAA